MPYMEMYLRASHRDGLAGWSRPWLQEGMYLKGWSRPWLQEGTYLKMCLPLGLDLGKAREARVGEQNKSDSNPRSINAMASKASSPCLEPSVFVFCPRGG